MHQVASDQVNAKSIRSKLRNVTIAKDKQCKRNSEIALGEKYVCRMGLEGIAEWVIIRDDQQVERPPIRCHAIWIISVTRK